jgi:hypothetical protein
MIEKLTPEQEAMLPVYKDKWLKYGLSTDKADREMSEKFITNIYTENKLPKPIFKWFDSPFAVIDYFKVMNKKSPEEITDGSKPEEYNPNNIMKNWIYGNHEAHWLSFYEFFLREVGLDCVKKIENFIEAAKRMGWWLPYNTHVFCCERPDAIEKKEDGSLHCESGPAISFRDGVQIFFLNGVKVTKELVMTPAMELDPGIILREDNAEVRREIVRKIGVERMCEKLNAEVIDKGKDHAGQPCELILLDIGDGNKRPYIKLINPSIGTYHVEGVETGIDTVEKALTWRNGTDTKPEKLT